MTDIEIGPKPEPGAEVARFADVAMYPAAPDELAEAGELIRPQVTLVSMTANPVRVMAAASELYAGRVIHDPREISRETSERWLRDMTKTALQAPLEFIDLHFLFEGVSRAWTHQDVRQRTAVFVQESQRFAVKENAADNIIMPPWFQDLPEDHPLRVDWLATCKFIGDKYNAWVNAGVPAEDARGILPTNIATKIHHKTNLRNLCEHAGMRLCTQAQFEWKQVWEGMVNAILNYAPCPPSEAWQLRAIVSLFKPVCFRTGKCEFMAETDRWCRIRDRVEAHHAAGEPPSEWSDIDPLEPLRYGAARLAPDQA